MATKELSLLADATPDPENPQADDAAAVTGPAPSEQDTRVKPLSIDGSVDGVAEKGERAGKTVECVDRFNCAPGMSRNAKIRSVSLVIILAAVLVAWHYKDTIQCTFLARKGFAERRLMEMEKTECDKDEVKEFLELGKDHDHFEDKKQFMIDFDQTDPKQFMIDVANIKTPPEVDAFDALGVWEVTVDLRKKAGEEMSFQDATTLVIGFLTAKEKEKQPDEGSKETWSHLVPTGAEYNQFLNDIIAEALVKDLVEKFCPHQKDKKVECKKIVGEVRAAYPTHAQEVMEELSAFMGALKKRKEKELAAPRGHAVLKDYQIPWLVYQLQPKTVTDVRLDFLLAEIQKESEKAGKLYNVRGPRQYDVIVAHLKDKVRSCALTVHEEAKDCVKTKPPRTFAFGS